MTLQRTSCCTMEREGGFKAIEQTIRLSRLNISRAQGEFRDHRCVSQNNPEPKPHSKPLTPILNPFKM